MRCIHSIFIFTFTLFGFASCDAVQQSPNSYNGQFHNTHLDYQNVSARKQEQRQQREIRKLQKVVAPNRIDAKTIPKYVTELRILPVLHDDNGKESHFEVALRQFEQQMLPIGYPKTLVWGFGNPSDEYSFHHPAGTMEVTRNTKTYVTWRNELIKDPIMCQKNGPTHSSCQYVKHLLQDKFGTPVVDTTLHWAAPDRRCANSKNRTDCTGLSTPRPYDGPIPMVPHVHGAHVEPRSDGYPEAWFLPKSSNTPSGYATEGSQFRSRYLPGQQVPDKDNLAAASQKARGQGYAVFRYTNDQETTALWYHDHTLGMTRLNVYAGSSGFWFIRTSRDGELRLASRDVKQKPQSLPGPPPQKAKNPNSDRNVRKRIREVPLIFQDQDFYSDGRLFYSANRVYFDYPGCNDGTNFASRANGIPYKPESDVSPVWNPESFFSAMVVNGNTFPKFTVAPERYRLRLLNSCDSRTLNLALKVGSITSQKELPFYVIGSDQGMLPQVVKLRTGYATAITPGKPITKEVKSNYPRAAMLMGPSERYDTIVDFAGLANGTAVYMINTAPDSPFGGFQKDGYTPADPSTSGQVMKFIIDYSLRKSGGDSSTSPYDLVIQSDSTASAPPVTKVRDLSIFEYDSLQVCVKPPAASSPCNVPQFNCKTGIIDPLTGISSLTYGPIHANLGINGRLGPGKLISQKWMDPILQNPALGSTEIWEFWNWTVDGHPLHVHLVAFKILGRYDMSGKKISGPNAYEMGKKDTVISLPGQVTRIQLTFDIPGLYVWHCHILSHEDNDMMVPYCVGKKGVDCPASLF